ncbi:MAG TPA: RNase adapter RapZ [Dissulfurispiraceae bacterium]|nr:RNase adapter RapZ [Dissulfurispiraceae bacterium]
MTEDDSSRLGVVIVSGLSGAGKTVALRALEDSGYFCIDNLPVTLIGSFLSTVKAGHNVQNVGIGVDIREKGFLADAYSIICSLKESYLIEILFLEADKEVMIRRFKETRRPHPMIASKAAAGIEDAIEEEKRQLAVLRESADKVVDTSNYTPHQLRQFIITSYDKGEKEQGLNISIISFGFKFGAPQSADLLFDVRFLPNPYFVTSLKQLTGLDKKVADYVMSSPDTWQLLAKLNALLDFLIPRYIKEGRSYLIIGVGCTGGKHRSPAIALELAGHIRGTHGIDSTLIHRDIDS